MQKEQQLYIHSHSILSKDKTLKFLAWMVKNTHNNFFVITHVANS